MKIVPLSQDNLDETIAMAHKVFPFDALSENPPERGFRKSLSEEASIKLWSGPERVLSRLNYWVLLDDASNKVIGVTGIYAYKDAPKEAWLAWYCLSEEARGQGLGRKLLEWTMSKAKEEGYTIFRLYTYTDPDEAAAQKLYESVGFKITKEEPDPHTPYKKLYRQAELK